MNRCKNISRDLRNNRSGVLDFDDYMVFCKAGKVQPVIVVNVYTGSPIESANWVKHAKDNNFEVAGWELGNELSYPTYEMKYPQASDYIQDAKAHAKEMRKKDPNVKLGVPITNLGFVLNPTTSSPNRAQKWIRELKNESFFDAYVVHVYIKPTYDANDPDVTVAAKACDIFPWSYQIIENAKSHYISDMYPQDREIWVTEWNTKEIVNNRTSSYVEQIFDSLLHVLYIGDFFTGLINLVFVSIAGHHLLSKEQAGFAVFDPKKKSKVVQWIVIVEQVILHSN